MSEPQPASWHVALGYALTGEELALPWHPQPRAELLVDELAGLGWAGERLSSAARTAHPVPQRLRTGLGAAQFWAVLARVRELIGATGAVDRIGSSRTPDAAERRLLADRPPHHG